MSVAERAQAIKRRGDEIRRRIGKCPNCRALQLSQDKDPAVPQGGSSADRFHTCPRDGNQWVQPHLKLKLWRLILSEEELADWQKTLGDQEAK